MNSDRPWMTALEMQFAALRAHKKIAGHLTPATADSVGDAMDLMALRHLPKATAYAWTKETCRAVWLASRSLPKDIVLSADAFTDIAYAWWWFEDPLPVPLAPVDEEHIGDKPCALLIGNIGGSEFRAIDYRPAEIEGFGSVPMPNGLLMFPFGHTLAEYDDGQNLLTGKTNGRRARDWVRFLLAASVWLRQRIVSVDAGHVERHRRKQLARENDTIVQSDVKIIQLRRYESNHQMGDVGAAVEWSFRWIVGGHWRNQYYPSTGKHELKYILPYVKGPSDKPLKVPTHTVYQVSR